MFVMFLKPTDFFLQFIDLVGDGTKTPTGDDTINQKQAETYNQKSQRS